MCHLLQIYIHILPRYSNGFFSPPSGLCLYSPSPWTFPRPTHFTLHPSAHSFPAFFVSTALIIHFHTVNCSPQLQCPGGLANLPSAQEQQMWVGSLGQEDPLEEGMATHSSFLAWRIPWTEEPGGLQSIGLKRAKQDWSHLACSRQARMSALRRLDFCLFCSLLLCLVAEVVPGTWQGLNQFLLKDWRSWLWMYYLL